MNYLACLTVLLAVSAPEDAFQSNVRPTEPLTAEEQQKTFHLPPGFEIQLFAAEPDIQKPMNLAIDAAGRLWMSGSVEYPYAAKDGDGHDAIKVLEDTDGDGRADKITTFVDGLNIPIGLYPYRDGVVAYSMPNIWFFRDTDGDGKADKREVLYGPLGVPKDTHGMQNAFRRGFDGWLYVNHGFANETEITARDGSSVKLQSGNTYRLRLDGSRVEQFSWGQVNPFGSTFLPDGDRITADCHSKPLTLLLRGAYYSSFGKSHDGLGFAPDLMTHSHGSTAICGVVHLTGSNFPPEYHGRLLVGNVMTSRVNQDSLTYAGSTARAIERPDFLSTDDPWFRPVDLQLGPDGAIYIADFYNRIIGHYEVPLEHPGRDKHRARIWRVTYRGQDTKAGGKSDHPLAQADVEKLIDALGSENFSRRMLASDQLADRIGGAAVAPLMAAATNSSSETIRVHALWILHRLQKLPPDVLVNAAQDSSRELLRVHAQRILSETNPWTPALHESVQRGLADQSMLVRRAAADAAGQQKSELVADLLRALPQVPKADSALRYSIRMAIRNQLRRPESWKSLPTESLTDGLRRQIEETALAVPNEHAAEFLYKQLQSSPAATNRLEAQLAHLAVNLPANRLDDLTALVRDKAKQDMDLQAKLLLSLNQRLNQRGVQESAAVRKWGTELAASLLTRKDSDSMWTNRSSGNPWGLESRNSDDGVATTFLSSLPGGEQQMGVLRSKPFLIPPKLKFYICGHLGLPNASAVEKNYVQLKLTDSDKVIAKSLPPRNDTARLVEWELGEHAGKNGFLEVVDQLDLDAYAWLAVARFEPPVVEVPSALPVSIAGRQIAAAGLISTMKLSELRNLLLDLIEDAQADWRARQAASTAYLAGSDRPLLAAMCAVLGEPTVDLSLREAIVETISSSDPNNDGKILVKLMQSVPSREQRQVADGLAATATGSGTLVELIERGHAAARLVQDRVIRQKIAAHGIADLEARLDRLTASLPTINLELQRLIDERRREIASRQTNVQSGQEIFTKHCAVCHQVGGKGALVGPQLDGIGNRGLARVIEDVLDPNRNVDATFHVSVLTMADGRVLTGLVRREEGANLILADQQGKEFSVLRSDIDERNLTSSSLMPANVHELLKPDQFYDLMGFLLTLRASQEK